MKTGMAACLALALCAPTLQAQERTRQLELRVGGDQLSNDTPDWRNYELHGRWQREALSLRGSARQVERYGLDDQEYALGGDLRLGPDWVLGADLSTSPDHAFLPELAYSAQISWAAGAGWVLGLGGRHSEYSEDTVNLGILSVEKYVGSLRAAYSLFHGRIEGGGSGSTHVGQLDWFYRDESRVGLSYASGREVTRIDPLRVIAAKVSSLTLLGTHWFAPEWGLNWSLGYSEQGDFYDRSGAQLGLVYRF